VKTRPRLMVYDDKADYDSDIKGEGSKSEEEVELEVKN